MQVNRSGFREVRSTSLTVVREAINWELLRAGSHFVRYDMPPRYKNDKHYYPRMHTWYKETSGFPCYLHTFGPHLYVKYGCSNQVGPLSYQNRLLHPNFLELQDERMLPWILKLLVADFFKIDGRFVSNADFFLWATADRNYVTGLKIQLNHNWRERNETEFVISDEAARLRKLKTSDFEKINEWMRKNKIYYGRFYTEGMAVFQQLKPDQLTRTQLKDGIYELVKGSSTNRASLTFHSVKRLADLRQSRSYLLNQFIDRFVAYLNELGLPFQRKLLHMQAMHTKSIKEMKNRQLPIEQKPIYIVDDRLNARFKPDNFASHLSEVTNDATTDHDKLFMIKLESDLQPGDWVLRIQDYAGGKDEFDSEKGILKDSEDGKSTFYERHDAVVKQTMNVNSNSKQRQKNPRDKKAQSWTADDYLNYAVPTVKGVKSELEVCRNQLLLKDVIMYPEDASVRLPQLKITAGMIFLYRQSLAYFDGCNLHFRSVVNNLEGASAFIREHTSWDLIDDILIPSAEQYYYDYTTRTTAIEDSTKRPFVIGDNFIWEIWEDNGRVVHDDNIIQDRLEVLEESIPTKKFYPPQPIIGNNLFTNQQLQSYAQFLDHHVRESVISYRNLTQRYGKHIKDDRGRTVVKDGGFYGLLGVQNASKFKRYLNEYLDMNFESVREDHLFPVYRGIWYDPNTYHYVAGVKDPNPQEQERGHVLRKIIVHQGEQDSTKLKEQLAQVFFPLLEVNFIRYRNYTVLPFPFRLIDMWQDINLVHTTLPC